MINEMMLLEIAAKIYPLIKDQELTPSQGVVAICANLAVESKIVDGMKSFGAVQSSNRKKESFLRNYKLYFLKYRKMKNDAIFEDYLEDTSALKLVIGVLLPDSLCSEYAECLLIFDESILEQSEDEADAKTELTNFFEFSKKNSAIICRTIKLFKQRIDMKERKVSLMLKAAACAWCEYFRETKTEEQTQQEKERLIKLVDRWINISENYLEFDAVARTIGELFVDYVNSCDDIIIGTTDEVDSAMAKAIERRRGIFEDRDFFFVPEELLREACMPLLDSISFLSIKRELHKEGYLLCNNMKSCNYTTKVLITNVYGYSCRIRFLKLRRELFESTMNMGFKGGKKGCFWAT